MNAGWILSGNGSEGSYMAERTMEATCDVMTLLVTR